MSWLIRPLRAPLAARVRAALLPGKLKPLLSDHGQSGQKAFTISASPRTPATTNATDSRNRQRRRARSFGQACYIPEDEHGIRHPAPPVLRTGWSASRKREAVPAEYMPTLDMGYGSSRWIAPTQTAPKLTRAIPAPRKPCGGDGRPTV